MSTRWTLGLWFVAALAACGGGSDAPVECGDGVVAGAELCDDGNLVDGDGCSSACQLENTSCGDGVVDVATETCDDGNTASGDGCSSTCRSECGNGMLDGPEACDDGNTAAGDGCSVFCLVETDYTCTGEPSDCIKPTGSCSDPFLVTLTNNAGTLSGMGMGDTTMGTNQVEEALCDGYPSGGGNDHIWQFTLTDTRDVKIKIDSATFDSALRLLTFACDINSEISERLGEDGCSDSGFGPASETLNYTALPAGTYFVVIDAYDDTEAGTYYFSVTASATTCGNGTLELAEVCDDGNTDASDGCSPTCDVEAGYACTGEPSVCGSACGNGLIDMGEECDDDNTMGGDRCSATCTLESDVMEVEPNDSTAQVVTAGNHIIRGSLTSGDVDLYTFTLTAPATVQLETYSSIDLVSGYTGYGSLTNVDCGIDTEIRIYAEGVDVTMDALALSYDDEDGDASCSYLGPTDGPDFGGANPMEGVLPAGTYTIKVNHYFSSGTATYYLLDLNISSSTPGAPLPGDLVLNEFMAGDNMSDTNCDGVTTGTNDEFVELVNVSTKVLDLTGVTIEDSVVVRHTFAPGPTGSMMLEPGKAIVVWGGGAPACPGVTNWFVASSNQLGLNDAGDTITVKDAMAGQLLQVMYPAATLNVSSNRSPDLIGTTYALHNSVMGAVGDYSPGKRANGTAF